GEVRKREQPVRRGVAERLPVPGLHQRARRREQEIRQADRGAQQPQDEQRRLAAVAARLPLRAGNDGQQREAYREERHVEPELTPRREPARRHVGVGVAEQQDRLEEDETGRPYRRRAAEPGQDLLRDDRLNEKEQE